MTWEPAVPGVRQRTRDHEARIGKSCTLPVGTGGLLSMPHRALSHWSQPGQNQLGLSAVPWFLSGNGKQGPALSYTGVSSVDTELHRVQEGMAGHTRGPEEVVTIVCWVLTHAALRRSLTMH